MNKYKLQEMSQGINPPKARVDIPEGFEVHMYANQRKNIWEIQKDQMRKVVANDKEHFYTYSKDNLSGSFPLVNETEARLRAKQESEARWLNKKGFDKLGKRTNWNEHPKKPDPAKMDDLRYPHVKQAAVTKAKIDGSRYRPEDDGKPVFLARANPQMTFSHPDYFNTVFASGDSVTQEAIQRRQKEVAEFERKVVVDN